jgi:sulfonate transport system permease protein
MSRLRRAARGTALPLLILAAWELASRTHMVDQRILPPLETIAQTAARELLHRSLLFDLAVSLARDMAGFVGGTIVGMVLGTILGVSRLAERLVLPTFNGLRQIAILAWIPLIALWFGFGDTAKVVFILLSAFVPVVLNTFQGVRATAPHLMEVATALRFTRLQRITRLFLPGALPSILIGVHLALIYSWVAAIGSEYFMTVGPGIGGLIIAGRERFEMDLVLLGMLMLGIVGFLINRVASVIEARLLRWSE